MPIVTIEIQEAVKRLHAIGLDEKQTDTALNALMRAHDDWVIQHCIDAVKAKMTGAVAAGQDGINVGLGIAVSALEELKIDGR